MSLFQNLLSEVTKRLKTNQNNKNEIAMIISQEIGGTINTDEIKIVNSVLFINTSPTIKSIIYLKKQSILKKLIVFNVFSIQ